MEADTKNVVGPQRSYLRIVAWAAAGLILLVPLVAMQFTDEVNWSVGDFVIAGALLLGVGFTYEFAVRKTGNTAYRVAVGVGLAAALLLIWVNGAVGIIGSENNDANLLYVGVLAIAIVGSILARFKPQGMAITMFAAAAAQTLVPVLALIIWPGVSWGAAGMSGVFTFNAFFVILFVVSAALFRNAARRQAFSVEEADD